MLCIDDIHPCGLMICTQKRDKGRIEFHVSRSKTCWSSDSLFRRRAGVPTHSFEDGIGVATATTA